MPKKKLPPLGKDLGKAEYMSDAKTERERGRLKGLIKSVDKLKPAEGSMFSWGRAMRKVDLGRLKEGRPQYMKKGK